MSADFILGIDPGASGAIAILDLRGGLVDTIDMPTVEVQIGKAMKHRVSPELIAEELRMYAPFAVAFIEKVGAMPGQGVSSMFAFGEAYGLVRGVLAGMSVPCTFVVPSVWTKAMRVEGGKDGSRKRAMELFPEKAGLFRRVKDNGRADAALIAAWGKQA
jgi:crossover junction endodeoxyribonuclease RuvC